MISSRRPTVEQELHARAAGLTLLRGDAHEALPLNGIALGSLGPWSKSSLRIIDTSPRHTIMAGPDLVDTDIQPALETWRQSAVVLEVDHRLSSATDHVRSMKAANRILRFTPASMRTLDTYNPLAEIRLDTRHALDDAVIIVDELLPMVYVEADSVLTMARDLLSVMLLGAATRGQCLADVFDALDDDWNLADIEPGTHVESLLLSVLSSLRRAGPVFEAAVMQRIRQALSPLQRPAIRESTRNSTFKLRHISDSPAPATLYISQPVDEAHPSSGSSVIARIVISQLVARLVESPDHQHPCLLVIPAAHRLGRVQALATHAPYLWAHGCKALLGTDTLRTLLSLYGSPSALLYGAGVLIATSMDDGPEMTEICRLSTAIGASDPDAVAATLLGLSPRQMLAVPRSSEPLLMYRAQPQP